MPNTDLNDLNPETVMDVKMDKMRKDLQAAHRLASENHPLDHYKDLLQQYQEELIQRQKEKEAKAQSTPAKKSKKAKAPEVEEDEDVDMADADEPETKDKKAKKRKAEENAEVCVAVPPPFPSLPSPLCHPLSPHLVHPPSTDLDFCHSIRHTWLPFHHSKLF